MNAVPWIPGSYYTVPMNPDLMEDLHIFGSIGVFYIMGMGLIYISLYRRYPPHYGHGAWDSSLYRRYPYPIILLIHCAWHDQPWRHTKLEHLWQWLWQSSQLLLAYTYLYIYKYIHGISITLFTAHFRSISLERMMATKIWQVVSTCFNPKTVGIRMTILSSRSQLRK